jgi:hypothetical protein
MMIEIGKMTLIDNWPYQCVKIEDGYAHLKKVAEESRGRLRKYRVDLCPYFDEKGQIIIPIPQRTPKRKAKILNLSKIIKDEVNELSVSNDLIYFVKDQIEGLVRELAHYAEQNAVKNGKRRIMPSHWYVVNLSPNQGHGVWPDHNTEAKMCKEMYE